MSNPLHVVFLIDALGWEVAERFDFARDILSVRAPLGTVLGYSAAAIPSLLSGTTPDDHGSWAMFRRAQQGSPFGYLKMLPRLPHALEWRMRRLVRRITDKRQLIHGYYDLYEIPVTMLGHFDVAQHQNPYEPGGLSRETVFDRFVAENISYKLWHYTTPEAQNIDACLAAVDPDIDLLFLYTAELDALMHRVGIFDDQVREKLAVYEEFLAALMSRGRSIDREIIVHVLSDHGMTDVHSDVDIWGELSRRGLHPGKDYLAFFDSTMARFWAEDTVVKVVSEILDEHRAGALLTDEQLKRYGCYFPDGRYGTSVFLMNPGVMVVPSFMGQNRIGAMHGYDPEDRFSLGCFMSTSSAPGGSSDSHAPLPESILGFKDYLFAAIAGSQ